MKAVVQRVTSASVSVSDELIAEIGGGVLVFVGVMAGDSEEDAEWLARKLANLRIFAGTEKPMDRSLIDVGGSVLVVSQFTLAGVVAKGNRPNFGNAEKPAQAEALFDQFVRDLSQYVDDVQVGRFGANMQVSLTNDGPVTILLERVS